MDSLSQNWPWILVALGVLAFFLFRAGHRGHGGFGHAGSGRGGHSHGGDGDQDGPAFLARHSPEAAIDPVSGAPVRTAGSPTSVHQGQVYYFASKENRDRFEASPGEFSAKATGGIVNAAVAPERPHRRRHGC